MFGSLLPKGPKGQVDAGIGKAASSGTVSFIPPTEEIDKPVQEMTIDGVKFVFQQTPGTEAPVEMNFYLPEFKALCMAENVSAGLHNLLTPRGAQVRDGRAWARFIDEAIDRFAGDTEVVFTGHHWPRWGKERIADYLKKQRDLYKYIHDQTVRLMNQGYTPAECAERIQLPPSLAREWFDRDFYGTVNFNVKAVYQRYLGWFDANPAHLHPLPPRRGSRESTWNTWEGPAPSSPGPGRTSARANTAGWLQALNHVVFAEPENREARELQADVLEQLGYQSESPVWRNFYLSGAKELRDGVRKDAPLQQAGIDVIRSHVARHVFRCSGRSPQRPEGGRQTDRGELDLCRSAGGIRRHPRKRGPEPQAGQASRRSRRHGLPEPRGIQRHRGQTGHLSRADTWRGKSGSKAGY